MCGIFSIISRCETGENNYLIYDKCIDLLKSRGPDCLDTAEVCCDSNVKALFAGCVLWTQGRNVFKQPAIDQQGNILLWNGDIYSEVNKIDKSDTETLLGLFKEKGVVDTLRDIEGPYSFIYYDAEFERVLFGRDPLGRISLLWSITDSSLILTSVSSPSLAVEEVPPLGIFVFHTSSFELCARPWDHQSRFNYSLPIHVKVDHPITFKKLNNLNLPIQHDLSEVLHLTYLKEFHKNNGDVPLLYSRLLEDGNDFSHNVNYLHQSLDEAVRLRCSTRPSFCQKCKPNLSPCCHPKVGILFSGGLDSTLLALLSDKHIPPNEAIDLYNVAFEKPSSPNGPFSAPDRMTGLSTLNELRLLSPHRTWNFVEINVSREELDSKRNCQINKLIYPLNSILDESLGCALWFASSGSGTLNNLPYTSPATVVLLGMGADEMFGGYRKARKVWNDTGWPGLCTELVSGLINLPIRNLGRDSRIVSDHSRVPRFPFLDENVVSFVYSLPPWQKCYLGKELPEGVGDKMLLRLLAWKLGLRTSALLAKRALQFGSRIANSKEMGHSISSNLLHCWKLSKT